MAETKFGLSVMFALLMLFLCKNFKEMQDELKRLISTLQEVADYDKNATIGLDSAFEITFDVNKSEDLKEND